MDIFVTVMLVAMVLLVVVVRQISVHMANIYHICMHHNERNQRNFLPDDQVDTHHNPRSPKILLLNHKLLLQIHKIVKHDLVLDVVMLCRKKGRT